MKNFRRSTGEIVFDVFNVCFLSAVAFSAVYPFLCVVAISLSTPLSVAKAGLTLVPTDISLTAYKMILSDEQIRIGYLNSIFRTVVGTALTLIATALAAYPLAHPKMPWRKRLIFFVLFTMLFSGGLVPRFLLIKSLGLVDSRWVFIIPGLLGAFSIFILKNFFQNVPSSYGEAARLDGAGEFSILFRIYLPLSKPALATIALWSAVGHWNSWFDGLIFISDDRKQVLQVFLQRIVVENSIRTHEYGLGVERGIDFSAETVKAACIVVTVLPMLLVYPFVQRYFIKGINIGGIKE